MSDLNHQGINNIPIGRSSSLQNNIIHDEETPETISYMIQEGRKALQENPMHFDRFLNSLQHEITNSTWVKDIPIVWNQGRDEEDAWEHLFGGNLLDFTCGARQQLDVQDGDMYIESLITELLRFLAMKILLGCIVPDDEVVVESRIRQPFPSEPVMEAWKCLCCLPITYQSVCNAMGVESHLDFEDGVTLIKNQDYFSQKMWNWECYKWTLETYQAIFHQAPERSIWPLAPGLDDLSDPKRTFFSQKTYDMVANKLDHLKKVAQNPCAPIPKTLIVPSCTTSKRREILEIE